MIASSRRHPRGLAIVPVLLCFVLILLLCGALFRVAVARRDQLRSEDLALQTEWLVESGCERAAAQLARSSQYRGETWTIPAAELGGSWGATVSITVEQGTSDSASRLVTVAATYPDGH